MNRSSSPPPSTPSSDDSNYDYYSEYDSDGGGIAGFCGDPLWGEGKFGNWTPPLPFLTWCFQHAVLAELPVLFFFATLPLLCIQMRQTRRELQLEQQQPKAGGEGAVNRPSRGQLPYNTLASMRYLLSTLMLCDKFFVLLYACYEWWKGWSVPAVEFVSPLSQVAMLTGLLWADERSRLVGLVSPAAIFCTWALIFLTSIPEFYVWMRLGSNPESVAVVDFYHYLAYLIWFPVCSLQFVLHFFSTAGPMLQRTLTASVYKGGRRHWPSPENLVSFPSRQLFTWFSPLVRLGKQRPLREEDVFELEPEMKAERLYARWTIEWRRRLREYYSHSRRLIERTSSISHDHRRHVHYGTHEDGVQVGGEDPHHDHRHDYDDQSPLLLRQSQSAKVLHGTGKNYGSTTADNGPGSTTALDELAAQGVPSVIATLFALFKWELLGAAGIKFASDLLTFVNPLVLGELIGVIETAGGDNSTLWYGFVLAATLFFASELRSLLFSATNLIMYRLSVQVQSMLTAAVYAKTLRLSSGARRARSTGEIANLLVIDVERFQALIPQLQLYWSSPLQVAIALFLLYRTIGWAVLGGVGVMLLLVPTNFFVSVHVKKWQVQQMELKDERLKMTNEVLSGIRVVKLYAWEPPMLKLIEEIRAREMRLIKRAALIRTFVEALNITSPFLVSIVSFALYTLSDPTNHVLTPQVAFVSLALFSQLRMPMIMVAELVAMTVQAVVSNRRLKNFLVEEEFDETSVERDYDPEYERSIDAELASFDWSAGKVAEGVDKGKHNGMRYPYTLNDVQLHVKRGILVTVLGEVGAGKSSLLSALLGEIPKCYGYVGVRGRMAYCPQQSWVQNRSLKANITLSVDDDGGEDEKGGGSDGKFDAELYNKVLEACDLRKDISQLPNGDRTLIGEKGINLSGGQKARLGLARALYQRADIYLLDDPLSAVDAIVARHLFDRAIGPKSMLRGATRLLVSHSLAFVADSDLIVVLEEGRIKRIGVYSELVADAEIRHLITRLEKSSAGDATTAADGQSSNSNDSSQLALPAAANPNGDAGNHADEESESSVEGRSSERTRSRRRSSSRSAVSSPAPVMKRLSRMSSSRSVGPMEEDEEEEEEVAATGRVRFSVYKQYFRAMGLALFWGFVIFMVANTVGNILNSFWLSDWSDDNSLNATAAATPPLPLSLRLSVYTLIGMSGVVFFCLANVCLVVGSVNASIHLHQPLLLNLLHSRVAFYDVTPLGRVLNRFGKEMDTVDLRLSGAFRFLAVSFLTLAQVFVVITITTPLFLLLAIPLVVVYAVILRRFIPTSRQLQRLNSITRSPLYSKFTELIQGATSIRAYRMEERFFHEFRAKIDAFSGSKYLSLVANRWLSVRLEIIGSLIILSAASVAVLSQSDWLASIGFGAGSVTAGLVGLSVSKSLDITYMLSFLIRQISEVETSVVSVERILEYSDPTQQEAAWSSEPLIRSPPKSWPSRGSVSFRNLTCSYRPGLPPCLNQINADIQAGERIGVVGRTGAGKTSLTWALLRLIEPLEGRIFIDQIDIASVGLHELRSRCTVIPQDPVLFSGTLRFNLDPFDERTDRELWTALEHAHLKEFVMARSSGLYHPIEEMGENLSVGQRQLICLARAILRRSPLIILDEATASVDQRTDALIQHTIREQFNGGEDGQDSTVITIAHRLSTVMDYDKVMVMEQGRLVEFDSPQNLMADRRSLFHALVQSMASEDDGGGSRVAPGSSRETSGQ